MSAALQQQTGLVALPVQSDRDAGRLIAVLDEVWGGDAGSSHLHHGMVIALAHTGEYAMVYEQDGQAVGAGLGFFGAPRSAVLHSHIVGVVPSAVGRGIGLAIKQHQREWCLERGVRDITWTFDPLVGRNAAFNLRKLGARAEHYLENFYGDMADGINDGQATDRLLVRWALERPAIPPEEYGAVAAWVTEDHSGEPIVLDPGPDTTRRSIRVPRDVEQLRRIDPGMARRWRVAVRDVLGGALAEGWVVLGFRAEGDYVLERTRA